MRNLQFFYKKISTAARVSILLVILCIAIILVWYLFVQNSPNYSTSWNSVQKEEFWERRIRVVGGERAYQELVRINKNVPFLKGHTEAHIFGKALYIAEGIPGIVVCDDKFLSGCSHEFLSTAVQEGGIGVIPSLNKECAAYASSAVDRVRCQHGIGHGVVGILGYAEKDLLKSLQVCSTLDTSSALSVSACSSGVFMEYNQRFLLAEDRVVRPIKNDDLFYPCFDVLERDRSVCVYRLPGWWVEVLYKGTPTVADFGAMADSCRTLVRTTRGIYTQSCLRGVWYMIGLYFVNDRNQASDACTSTSVGDSQDMHSCESYVDIVINSSDSLQLPLSVF